MLHLFILILPDTGTSTQLTVVREDNQSCIYEDGNKMKIVSTFSILTESHHTLHPSSIHDSWPCYKSNQVWHYIYISSIPQSPIHESTQNSLPDFLCHFMWKVRNMYYITHLDTNLYKLHLAERFINPFLLWPLTLVSNLIESYFIEFSALWCLSFHLSRDLG